MDKDVRDALSRGLYERTEEGIYVPTEKALVRGRFFYNKKGEPEEVTDNLIVLEGRTYILEAAIGDTAGINNWYIALFTNAVTPQDSWTSANWAATAGEWTDYTPVTRPAWTTAAVASSQVDNYATKAEYTSQSDGQVVRGAALLSGQTAASDSSGTLIAAARLNSDKSMDTGEILEIGYRLELT